MTSAIYFHPEGYSTNGPKLMGRHVAGESFLRGLLEYGTSSVFFGLVDNPKHGEVFRRLVKEAGRDEPVRIVSTRELDGLVEAENLFYPGPNLGKYAWQRSFVGHDQWSLCGITHTTSSAGAMDSLADLLVAPVQPWDALICTSQAVKTHVMRILQEQQSYLHERLGISRVVLPKLPVIPLGIHTRDFEFSNAQRVAARMQLGADDKTHVVMFMGRLSFHAKAHPMPMYLALQRAVKRLPEGHRVLLVECGWYANDGIASAFSEASALVCPDVRVVTLDGRIPQSRTTAWAAADVCCSLSDNIQETFGIVPIEAMAAGIPVVVSDWDGYKDTVRDGIDGFRVASTMPPPGAGEDLARRHALDADTYDRYCGYSCSLISIDVEDAAEAFLKLFRSKDLSRHMGAAGRKRSKECYDWSVVIPQYEELWAEMSEDRKRLAGRVSKRKPSWPARLDPFVGFNHYSSSVLTSDTEVELAEGSAAGIKSKIQQYYALKMVSFAGYVLPTEAQIYSLIDALMQGGISISALASRVDQVTYRVTERAVAWMLKVGILRLRVPAPHNVKNDSYAQILNIVALGLKKRAGVTEARVDYPLGAMKQLPNVRVTWGAGGVEFPKGGNSGIFILHRQFMNNAGFRTQVEKKISQGWVVVADMDDDPHHWKEYVESDFYAFRAVHAVTVSTKPLARMMRQWNPNVEVFPNAVRRLSPVVVGETKKSGVVRVFFGAINRENDWKPIIDSLNSGFEAVGSKLEVVVVHDRLFFNSVSDTVRKEFHSTLEPEVYTELLASCDISLLPLLNTGFNRLKSDLKLIESCAASVVPICSPVVYAGNPMHREVAVFAKTSAEWRDAIVKLSKDPGMLKRIRERGRDYVEKSRTHDHFAVEREMYYRRLLMKRDGLEKSRRQRIYHAELLTK